MLADVDGPHRRALVTLKHPGFDDALRRVIDKPSSVRKLPAPLAAEVARYAPKETRTAVVGVDRRATVRAAVGAAPAAMAESVPRPSPGDGDLLARVRLGDPDAMAVAAAALEALTGTTRNEVIEALLCHPPRWREVPALAPLAAALLDGTEACTADLTPGSYARGYLIDAYLTAAGHVDASAARWLAAEDPEVLQGFGELALHPDAVAVLAEAATPAACTLLCDAGLVPSAIPVERVVAALDAEQLAEVLCSAPAGVREALLLAGPVPDVDDRYLFNVVPVDGLCDVAAAALLSWQEPALAVRYLLRHPRALGGHRAEVEAAARAAFAECDDTVRLGVRDEDMEGVPHPDLGAVWRACPAAVVVADLARAEQCPRWAHLVAGHAAAHFGAADHTTARVAFELLSDWEGTFAELFDTAERLAASAAPAAAGETGTVLP